MEGKSSLFRLVTMSIITVKRGCMQANMCFRKKWDSLVLLALETVQHIFHSFLNHKMDIYNIFSLRAFFLYLSHGAVDFKRAFAVRADKVLESSAWLWVRPSVVMKMIWQDGKMVCSYVDQFPYNTFFWQCRSQTDKKGSVALGLSFCLTEPISYQSWLC